MRADRAPAPYSGPDRRAMPSQHAGARQVDVAVDGGLLLAGALVVAVVAALASGALPGAAPTLTLVLGGLASGLCFLVSEQCYVRWTLVGDGVAIRVALAFVVYGTTVAPLVTTTADGAVGTVVQALGTGLSVGALLGAARAPEVDGGFRPGRRGAMLASPVPVVLTATALSPDLTLSVAAARLGAGPLLGVAGLSLVVVASSVLTAAGLRRDRRLLTASGVALVTLAATPVVMDLPDAPAAAPLVACAIQLAALLVVGRAAAADARCAIATAARYDVDLRLRWRHAVARAEQIVQVQRHRDHEIRSALLAIDGASRVIQDHSARSGRGDDAQLARAVGRETERLQHLVSGAPDDPPTSYPLREVLLPLVVAHRATGQRVDLDVPADLTAVGHPHALAEVVSNLLVNAARHASGARVRIARRAGPPGYVRLVVSDDGPGFPADGLAHAVERGWRGSTAPGNGLGLFLASRLMADEGGALTLLPSGDRGARIALDVPASVGEELAAS